MNTNSELRILIAEKSKILFIILLSKIKILENKYVLLSCKSNACSKKMLTK